MIVEVHGLELHGRHGVNDDERRDGQSFLFDVTLEIARAEGGHDRRDGRLPPGARHRSHRQRRESYRLLETLAAAIADALIEALPIQEGARARSKARHRLGRMDRRYLRAAVTRSWYSASRGRPDSTST